jgi:hypothetical protein
MTLDLTKDEKLALATELKRTIDGDRYPFRARILTLKAILDKIEPQPAGAELDCGTDANLVAHLSHRVGLPNYPAAAIGC